MRKHPSKIKSAVTDSGESQVAKLVGRRNLFEIEACGNRQAEALLRILRGSLRIAWEGGGRGAWVSDLTARRRAETRRFWNA